MLTKCKDIEKNIYKKDKKKSNNLALLCTCVLQSRMKVQALTFAVTLITFYSIFLIKFKCVIKKFKKW